MLKCKKPQDFHKFPLFVKVRWPKKYSQGYSNFLNSFPLGIFPAHITSQKTFFLLCISTVLQQLSLQYLRKMNLNFKSQSWISDVFYILLKRIFDSKSMKTAIILPQILKNQKAIFIFLLSKYFSKWKFRFNFPNTSWSGKSIYESSFRTIKE